MGWITHSLHQLGEWLPLSVHNLLVKRDLIGLTYHVVSDQKLAHLENLYPYKTPEMFENDLKYLMKYYHFVSYDQVLDYLTGDKKLPPKSVILTFDDGLQECYSVIRPLLIKLSIPCIFFVSTHYIDNHNMANELKASLCIHQIKSLDEKELVRIVQDLEHSFNQVMKGKEEFIKLLKMKGIHDKLLIEYLGNLLDMNFDDYLQENTPYLTADQIKQMNVDGFLIGSHGKEHEKLSNLPDHLIEESITGSCREINQLTGQKSIPFAFPHNADDISRELLRKVLLNNKHVGLLFDSNGIRQEERYLISRLTGDRPSQTSLSQSNLPLLIKRAYFDEISNRCRKLF